MTKTSSKPTKVTGVIRAQFDRIEGLLKSGYTVASVKDTIEAELGVPIKFRSFEWALYHVRRERKEQEDVCIAQYKHPPALSEKAGIPSVSEAQPKVDQPGGDGTPNPSPGEADGQESDSAHVPWKPKKKINPLLLALKQRQDRGELN